MLGRVRIKTKTCRITILPEMTWLLDISFWMIWFTDTMLHKSATASEELTYFVTANTNSTPDRTASGLVVNLYFHSSFHSPVWPTPTPVLNNRHGLAAETRDSDSAGLQIGPRGAAICSVVLSRAAKSPRFTISLQELINWNAFHYLAGPLGTILPRLDLNMQDACGYNRPPWVWCVLQL